MRELVRHGILLLGRRYLLIHQSLLLLLVEGSATGWMQVLRHGIKVLALHSQGLVVRVQIPTQGPDLIQGTVQGILLIIELLQKRGYFSRYLNH